MSSKWTLVIEKAQLDIWMWQNETIKENTIFYNTFNIIETHPYLCLLFMLEWYELNHMTLQ